MGVLAVFLQVMFKLDDSGNGKLVEIDQLGKANRGLVVSVRWCSPPPPPLLLLVLITGVYSRLLSSHVYPVRL